jgi:phosphoglucosamine mutase
MERLFGTDGIRGTTGSWPLVPDLVLRVGQALGTVLRRDRDSAKVVLGRDTRESGPVLQSCLTSGLLASGVDVIDLGIIPTPGVATLTRHLDAHAGVVISASHNPVEQNGIKLFTQSGQKLSDDMELDIERLALAGDAEAGAGPPARAGRWGRPIHHEDEREKVDVDSYARDLLREHPESFLRGVRLVVDCANGAAFEVAPDVFRRAGAEVVEVHCEPTGSNINVDCGSEHVRRKPAEMGALIRRHNAAFGVAFDGDADRVVFVDLQGLLVDGDHMLGVLARYLHDRGKLLAGTVVTTIMRNSGLKQYIEGAGITLEETPVGDKYVIERLIQLRRESPGAGMVGLGGEQAGHLVLLDGDHFTGDGLRTALYFARVFLEAQVPSLSQFAASVGKTPQIIASAAIGHRPRVSKSILAETETATLREFPGLIRVSLRYSGTEPLFRVMLEADRGRPGADLAISDLETIAVKLCRQVQAEAEMGPGNIDLLNCTSGGVTVV